MIRAFQWDLARQVERRDWLLAQLPRYADWGYQELYLHLEDAVDYPSLPGVGRADAYSWREFEQLVAAATRSGLRVVPIVNLLGHTQYLIKTPEWRDLNELRAADGSPLERGQICPLHPRTLEVAERLLADVAPFCTAGKVHVGLDESFHLGRHPSSQAEIAEVGLATHFARYVQRLHQRVSHHGLRMGLWADMLVLLPDAIEQLPRDAIAYDWYYHGFRRHPRFELYNFSEYDLATQLKAHGIEYWGCPMNGAFRFEPLPVFGERLANAISWWRRCRAVGAGGFLVTSWEPNRLAVELTTAVDAAIAGLWLTPERDDHTTLLTQGYERVFGAKVARRVARSSLATDATAFAGYARWEINDRWDIVSTHEGLAPAAAEARQLARFAAQPELPAPLAHSLAFRRYLAARDLFVRRAAKAVYALRRIRQRSTGATTSDWQVSLDERLTEAAEFAEALRDGRSAARAMWRLSRDPAVESPNERILAADRLRLRAWQRWLRRCHKNPDTIWTSSPVAGAWQLQFVVITQEPAVQRVVVEQQTQAGVWEERRGRHTIEFRTAAARPRAKLRRPFVVALEDPTQPLRLAVHGVGQVHISHVELTNGVHAHRPSGWPGAERRRLGRPAPSAGWPAFAGPGNAETLELTFGSA